VLESLKIGIHSSILCVEVYARPGARFQLYQSNQGSDRHKSQYSLLFLLLETWPISDWT
jgi:hypothetical protein